MEKAIKNAKTVEQAMELYIRYTGKESFLCVFGKDEEVVSLPLFDAWEHRSRSSDRIAASA